MARDWAAVQEEKRVRRSRSLAGWHGEMDDIDYSDIEAKYVVCAMDVADC